jgi:hypothetical protein
MKVDEGPFAAPDSALLDGFPSIPQHEARLLGL